MSRYLFLRPVVCCVRDLDFWSDRFHSLPKMTSTFLSSYKTNVLIKSDEIKIIKFKTMSQQKQATDAKMSQCPKMKELGLQLIDQ